MAIADSKMKKTIVSVVFGLVGFAVNMFPLRIYEYQGIVVSILPGLIFPLFIAIIWGWKYGLISALAGGCQAMWFLWHGDGYGQLYSVPVYTLWIVWHGAVSDYRRKKKSSKWYLNEYFADLFFRIFSELGFLTVFRWLVSKNPPFWDSSVVAADISRQWFVVTISKHVAFSLFLLLIIKIIIERKKVRELFKINTPKITGNSIITASLLVAVLLIFLEALGCTLFSGYNNATLLDNIINFSNKQLYTRSIMFIICLTCGIILSSFFNKSIEKNILLKKQEDKINSLLKLTERLGRKELNAETTDVFLSDLLKTSIEIIDEADYGAITVYEDDWVVFYDVVGHDKKLIGHKTRRTFDVEVPDVVIIDNGKQWLLEKVSRDEREKLDPYIKPSSESLVMILAYEGEKLAGLTLEKAEGHFSEESINMASLLKNIPIAYFTKIYAYNQKQTMFESIVFSIIKILSLHNEYTKKHSINVAKIASGIAAQMGLNENEIDIVYWTGLLHDIGKILISDRILNKDDKLTKEEWAIIKKHPVWGYETLNENESLREIAKYVLYHHERWDGKGFPGGIKGKDIPLISRILSVADAYDAMTNKRPYREALSKPEAIGEIEKNSGTQFDPHVTEVFIEHIDAVLARDVINDKYRH